MWTCTAWTGKTTPVGNSSSYYLDIGLPSEFPEDLGIRTTLYKSGVNLADLIQGSPNVGNLLQMKQLELEGAYCAETQSIILESDAFVLHLTSVKSDVLAGDYTDGDETGGVTFTRKTFTPLDSNSTIQQCVIC